VALNQPPSYKIDDYINGEGIDGDGAVVQIDEVYGRTDDELDIGNGVKFYGQSCMTCVEGFDQIIAYQ